jgi:MFS family permease
VAGITFGSSKMSAISKYLPFASSTTTVQACTYLFAICLFSISFLVFLNSSVSFVITDLIGVKIGVGDLVGTLGFVDELVALLACPFWGILSDRLGVRIVCVAGYTIVGLALFVFVQARNVYPQLLLARILFSTGGAAT